MKCNTVTGINWKILSHCIRIFVDAVGTVSIISFLYSLHPVWFVLAIIFIVGGVFVMYKCEIAIREFRLQRGLYY
jgi:hypothetical protein